MPSVYLDSADNSTFFTTCCNVAISGYQETCPRCSQDIDPKGDAARWSKAYGRIREGKSYGNYSPNDRPASDLRR